MPPLDDVDPSDPVARRTFLKLMGASLGLYDPDRAQTITRLGEIQPWSAFLGAIRLALSAQQAIGGAGVRLLTESITSPSLAAQIRGVLKRFPAAKWHQWDPMSRESAKAGAMLAFGRHVDTQYRFDRAGLVISLDADFLAEGAAHVRWARDFSSRRRPENADRTGRLYVVETMPSPTGACADHRLALAPSGVERVSRQLAAAIGVASPAPAPLDGGAQKWIDAVTKDLPAHP